MSKWWYKRKSFAIILLFSLVASLFIRRWVSTTTTLVEQKGESIDASYHDDHNVAKFAKDIFNIDPKDIFNIEWGYECSPIVIESHKLIFFTIQKVGCTVFKQLFRRMLGYDNWRYSGKGLPHNPQMNGLKYLFHYPKQKASNMLANENWTKAVFIREPKERFLSAYLDKTKKEGGWYIKNECCKKSRDCVPKSLEGFFNITKTCHDPHWKAQSRRVSNWDMMTFVGSFSNIHNDTKRLLLSINAWGEYGKSGWGVNGTEEIFGSTKTAHATGSETSYHEHYTKSLEEKVEMRYEKDYANEVFARHFVKGTLESE